MAECRCPVRARLEARAGAAQESISTGEHAWSDCGAEQAMMQ